MVWPRPGGVPAYPDAMHSPHTANTSGTTTRQRFGYFFIGLAIGMVLLGFFTSHRKQAERAEAVREAAREAGGATAAPRAEPPVSADDTDADGP